MRSGVVYYSCVAWLLQESCRYFIYHLKLGFSLRLEGTRKRSPSHYSPNSMPALATKACAHVSIWGSTASGSSWKLTIPFLKDQIKRTWNRLRNFKNQKKITQRDIVSWMNYWIFFLPTLILVTDINTSFHNFYCNIILIVCPPTFPWSIHNWGIWSLQFSLWRPSGIWESLKSGFGPSDKEGKLSMTLVTDLTFSN